MASRTAVAEPYSWRPLQILPGAPRVPHPNKLAQTPGARGPVSIAPSPGQRSSTSVERLNHYDSKIASLLRDEMRRWVEANGVASDGREMIDLVPRAFSNLSQSSIKRALGEARGAEELARLDALGCIERGERLELRQVKD